MKRKTKRDERRSATHRPKADPNAPTGIGQAAIRGAMQSEHERREQITGNDERQVQQDDDAEWRRAGGKSPE